MTRLVLVRHGQTPANVAGILDTAGPGPGLTELGARQAAAIPDVLAGRPIVALGVSTLRRTAETAAPLAAERGLAPVALAGLREIEAASVEGRSDRASVEAYIGTVAAWMQGDLARRMPGADTDGADFVARYDDALQRLVDSATGPDGLVVAVSHGAAIRAWTGLRAATGADRAGLEEARLANTAMVEVEGDPDRGWRLVSWTGTPAGDVGLVAARVADDPTAQPVDAED